MGQRSHVVDNHRRFPSRRRTRGGAIHTPESQGRRLPPGRATLRSVRSGSYQDRGSIGTASALRSASASGRPIRRCSPRGSRGWLGSADALGGDLHAIERGEDSLKAARHRPWLKLSSHSPRGPGGLSRSTVCQRIHLFGPSGTIATTAAKPGRVVRSRRSVRRFPGCGVDIKAKNRSDGSLRMFRPNGW